jgi:hypothetical protein
MDDFERCRKAFEALMQSNGRSDLTRVGDRYKNLNTQTKFRYFLLGWKLSK